MEAHQTAVSDPVSFPVKKGMTLTVSLYFADFTLMQSAVLVTDSFFEKVMSQIVSFLHGQACGIFS